MIGSTVSHYKIIEKLGEGGMGVVYKAEDTKLGRGVALKFLSGGAIGDEEHKSRFLHEARAAAALDHPNICGVFEIDEFEGRLFMALPFLEGQSLDKRIKAGLLPVREAIEIATQTAEGLEEAHGKEIFHRDIKPANIMLQDRGRGRLQCVLMDFGLARLSQATRLTREGSQLGTAAYMSPEQVQGAPTDHRSDIWALGVVIYEMILGQLPFRAEYEQAIFYGILNEQPEPMTAIRSGVPMELERIANKCLAKKPEERYQSCTDLIVDLNGLKRTLEASSSTFSRVAGASSTTSAAEVPEAAGHTVRLTTGLGAGSAPAPAAAPPERRRGLSLFQAAAAAVALAVVAAGAAWFLAPSYAIKAAWEPTYELKRITWDTGLSIFPKLSPDGKLLVYSSDRGGRGDLDIWVQQVDGGGAVRLTDYPGEDVRPTFSPDSTKIVYYRAGAPGMGVYMIPTLGGDPYLIAEDAEHPAFGPDGKTVVYKKANKLYVSPVSMGQPVNLMAGFNFHGWMLWSPDGSRILIAASGPDKPLDWWAAPAAGGEAQPIGVSAALEKAGLQFAALGAAAWDGAGPIISSEGDLWRVPVSTSTWKVSGPPERLTFGAGIEADAGASGSGRIAFTSIQERQNIWSLAIDTTAGGRPGEFTRLTHSDASDVSCDYALDAGRMVYISNRWGNTDIWTMDLRSGKESNLTNDAAHQQQPVISHDGSQVAYLTEEEGKPAIYVRPLEGGVGRRVCADCGAPRGWSPDKGFILYQRADSGATHLLNLENGETTEILKAAEGKIVSARFSPDGHWVAFRRELADRKGALLATPFRGEQAVPESDWVEIVSAEHVNDKPRWNPNGNILYFLSNRERNLGIWMQRLDPNTKRPIGEPESLRQFPSIRQSLETMDVVSLELAVGRDRLVLPVGELTGSIWLMEPKAATSDSTGPRP